MNIFSIDLPPESGRWETRTEEGWGENVLFVGLRNTMIRVLITNAEHWITISCLAV